MTLLFVAGLAFAGVSTCNSTAQVDSSASIEPASKAWRTADRSISTASWTARVEYYRLSATSGPALVGVDTYKKKQKRGEAFMFIQDTDESMTPPQLAAKTPRPSKRSFAFLSNAKYSAEISRAGFDAPWKLTNLSLGRVPVDSPYSLLNDTNRPWLCISTIRLDRFFEKPFIVVNRSDLTSYSIDGRLLSKASFCNTLAPGQSKDKDTDRYYKSGFIVFDTKNSYCPVEFELVFESPRWSSMSKGTIEYVADAKMPTPKVMTNETKAKSKKGDELWTREVTTFSDVTYNEGIDDSEFQLEAFSLHGPFGSTELNSASKSRVNAYMCMAAALVIGVVAVRWHRASSVAK